MHVCNPSTHEKKARDSGIQGHLQLNSVFRVSLSYIETLSQTYTDIHMHTRTYACTDTNKKINIFEKNVFENFIHYILNILLPWKLVFEFRKMFARFGFVVYEGQVSFFLMRRPFHLFYWSGFHENYYDSSLQSPCLL